MAIDEKWLSELDPDELDGKFSGELTYQVAKIRSEPTPLLPTYKVWNANPQKPTTPTPGIVMTSVRYEGEGDTRQKHVTNEGVVSQVKAVILYQSPARKLGRGNGPAFRVVCASCDGEVPRLSIDSPLCRKTTAEDVAKVFSQWKSYDQARIEGVVQKVTQGTDRLQFCGLKKEDGQVITLCPYGKKDADSGQAAACKQYVYLQAYDVERDREFQMELAGTSISTFKFLAPFHEFFKFLKDNGPNGRALPGYLFQVNLSVSLNGANYYLNVSDYLPVSKPEVKAAYKARAEAAYRTYQKNSERISNEAFKAAKEARETQKTSPPPVQTTQPIAFEEDDINF